MISELGPGREGGGKHVERGGSGKRTLQTKETAYAKVSKMCYLRNKKEASRAGAESLGHVS